MKKILLIFLCVFAFASVHADITWELSDDGTLTISGTGNMKDYNYNSSDNAPWYSQKDDIKNIVIMDGVTSIGNDAFWNHSNLNAIVIPNSVTRIGFRAFLGCSSLTSITIPNSVVNIGDYALYRCSGLTSVKISTSVTSIGCNTFRYCSNLTSITIPNSVTNIEYMAFADCSNLTTITIPKSVVNMGYDAFTGTKWYDNQPNGLVYVGSILYKYKGYMPSNTKIEIKDGTTCIAGDAFYDCSGLTSITIPNTVVGIGECAFEGCTSLTSVLIPGSVTRIGNGAFSGCSELNYITYLATTPPKINIATFTNYGTLHVFHGCKHAYESAEYWKDFTIVEDIEISNNTIYYTSIDGKSVTPNKTDVFGANIISNTYENGQGIITFDGDVTNIGNGAFRYCSDLTSIIIPNSVTSIGINAFRNCIGLTSITIPNSATSIGSGAFGECYGLITITIPNSVTSIGDYWTFHDCYSLISIQIPNSVTSIGNYAFSGCSGLTSLTIPNSVTNIGDDAFDRCTNLTNITNLSSTPQNVLNNTFTTYGTLHVLPGCKSAYENAEVWKNFTIVEDAVNPLIELVDGKTYNEEVAQENKEISYTRAFNNTKWQALYIPFSMSYDDWKDDFEVAFINSVRQYDNDEDGVVDETIMDVMKIKSGSLIPNTPYLIKAKSVGEKTITMNNATLYQAEENSIECSTMLAKYTFTGTYSTIPSSTMSANNYYAMGGGSLIMTDGTSDLKPFRWYLNIESRSPMYSISSAAKTITINVVGEEETTGISYMSSDREHSSAIYDLNGRKMAQKTLKPGLYIKNGKKIIIK